MTILEFADDGLTLADSFVASEARLSAERPDRVRIADDSDAALAAAITAAKLELPVEAAPAATLDSTLNGRLIAILAS